MQKRRNTAIFTETQQHTCNVTNEKTFLLLFYGIVHQITLIASRWFGLIKFLFYPITRYSHSVN